jgi:hypothetical protein
MGIQLRHKSRWGKTFVSREKFAISQGEGRNITEGNEGGLQYTSRLELLPFGEFKYKGDYSQSDLSREESLKVMFSVTYDYNQNAIKTRSNMGSYLFRADGSLFQTDISTWFVDAMVKYDGFALMGEYAKRSADELFALQTDGQTRTGDVVNVGSALNLQSSYLFQNNVELTVRYTTLDFSSETKISDLSQLTFGLSKYVVGHKLKIQTDLSFSQKNGNQDYVQFRTGFDLHF